VRFSPSRGWNVLTFDLRGHGESVRQETRTALQPPGMPDTPWEAGGPLDLKAALAFAARQPKADPTKRAIIGLGLGADLADTASARAPPVAGVGGVVVLLAAAQYVIAVTVGEVLPPPPGMASWARVSAAVLAAAEDVKPPTTTTRWPAKRSGVR